MTTEAQRAQQLTKKLDTLYEFECEAGPLRNCLEWRELKNLLAGAAALRDDVCDACGGTGTPTSGLPCMCKGTGKMSIAALTLREQLIRAELDAERSSPAGLAALLKAYRAQHKDDCTSRCCIRCSMHTLEPQWHGERYGHLFEAHPCSCGLAARLTPSAEEGKEK